MSSSRNLKGCSVETWKDIPGYDGYMASSLGNFKSKDRVIKKRNRYGGISSFSHKGRVLVQTKNNSGYLQVCLGSKAKKESHYFVAITFIGPIGPKQEVNHIDFNRQNNSVENLEIVSRSKNRQHTILHGRHNRSKLSYEKVLALKKELLCGKKGRVALAKKYGISYSALKSIARGESWGFV